MTREQRKAAAKAKKEAAIRKRNQHVAQPGDLPPTDSEDEDEDDEDLPANPNHSAKSRSQAMAAPPVAAAAAAAPERKPKNTDQLSRREREALEAQQARERYMKLHMEGKTDEARADMERLKLVRERREAERARREAEKEEREAQAKARQDEISEREKKLREAAMGKPSRNGKKTSKKWVVSWSNVAELTVFLFEENFGMFRQANIRSTHLCRRWWDFIFMAYE